ncbi:MAG: hypothetical protein J1F22_07995 [Lachnospiraceae bacterium]|nr:hypothetical protein [Lachnospiraceae bacterium]
MRKRTYGKYIVVLLALSGTILLTPHTSHAAGESYNTALEKAYGDTFRGVYENKLAGSPLELEGADGVDTATGHLMLSRSDLSLEGTGGMDFELNRYYDSNEANLGHATVEFVDELVRNTVWVQYKSQDGTEHELVVHTALFDKYKGALEDLIGTSYRKGAVEDNDKLTPADGTQRTRIVSNEGHNVYGLASGWRFDFPWIETVTLTEEEGWGKIPAYLHYGSAGVLPIESKADTASKSYSITGLEGYDYQDVRLEDLDETVDGVVCKYLLRDKTGLRSYFNADGVLVLQKDAHDNTITFTYQDEIYFDTITDSVGRKIVFHYSTASNGEKALSSVTVQGNKTEGGVSQKTIQYETKEQSYTPLHGDRLKGLTLTSATVDGSKETYSYKTVERLFNTAGDGVASQRVSTNESYLLNKVSAEGGEQHYEYRACALRGERDAGLGQKRDVAVERFYVTREYEKDVSSGKKSGGQKYDYFQKQGNRFISYADFQQDKDEVWQYGKSGLEAVTVVSSFNPNKYKTNGKYYDYKYKKSKINEDTLRLASNTTKSVSLYIYNANKMLTEEVNYGKTREETLYDYDKDGNGSLVTLETNKTYGKNGKAVTSKEGHTYDEYRNVLTEKDSEAYLKKNSGKEKLYTTIYTYHGTDKGYPTEDIPFSLCTLTTEEAYTSANTKSRSVNKVATNGVDCVSISEQRSVNGGTYKTIFKTDFKYDDKGNETQGKIYPSYSSDGEKEVIQNDYMYNSLGQQTKKTMTLISAKRPTDNRTYTEEEVTYDSFGNELTHIDENGLVSKTNYNSETGEEEQTVTAVGTEYESRDKEYISTDTLKTMTMDEYGRVSIDIQDAFGNTIISKDEAAGTWIERTYGYGSVTGDIEEDDTDLDKEETTQLLEEKTYTFKPDEEKFIINENGEKVANFYITGKGSTILSATKHFYDDLGNEIGSAEFSNGELDAAHCTSWSFERNEIEVTGEEDNAQTISISYSKELEHSKYQSAIDVDNYYNQFNDAVLSETITETVSDVEGNTISQTSTIIRGKNKLETVTNYESDDFGRTIKENTVTKKYQDGKWLSAYETQTLSTYDENGNVSQIEIKSRKEGAPQWQSQITKKDYDEQGRVIREYTMRGGKEDVATKYSYDILGQMIMSEIPQKKKDGSIEYQKNITEYDNAGNVTGKEEQIDSDRTERIEYTYDGRGNCVMVKSCMEEDKAQYVQYVYDTEGNKVRQFTGMTAPLAITVSEGKERTTNSSADTFSYVGKTYYIEVNGKKKSDVISETKYEYDGKNQLIAYIDPEGRKETYTYDVNGNLIKTVDKNENILKNTYDYQNRLTEVVAHEKETGKETIHTYSYNAYGEVETQDDTKFIYGDVSGQVTKETTKLAKNKNVVKNYTYDSAGNKSAFSVKVAEDTKLSLQYSYDGESKLTSVIDENGNKVVGYTYDIDGNLSERNVVENNLTTTYTYDYQNHLIAMKNQTSSDGVISDYQSEYLVNGQKAKEISEIRDKEGKKITKTATYTYDLLGRIQKETRTDSEDLTYTYDSHNNRKEMIAGNKVIAYRYNKNDELLRTDTLNTKTEKDSVVIFKNDKNGNQLAVVNRKEAQGKKEYFDMDVTLGENRLNDNAVYHYNALNQLTSMLTRDNKVCYTYDAEGLRTSKKVNGKTTIFVWDGNQLVMELSEDGKVQKRFIRGNDLVYADEGNETEKQYYVTNPHGDVAQLINKNGKVIKMYEYDSFGNEVDLDKKDDNPFRYCGEYYDKETDEIYLRARYYQPSEGRFITRDIYTGEEDEPLSLHLYTYCYNDPITYADNGGNCPTLVNLVVIGKMIYDTYTAQNNETSNNMQVFAYPYTDPWSGMPKKAKKHIGYLSVEKQIENAKYIENYLMIKGLGKSKNKWTREAVAGLIGNLVEECGVNPGQWERWKNTKGRYSGYGLCQWTPSNPFFKWAKLSSDSANKMAKNNPKQYMNLQLKYMWKTMTTKNIKKLEWFGGLGKNVYHSPFNISAKEYIKSKKSVKKLAKTFCGCYLRPDNVIATGKLRAMRAKDWYKRKVIKEQVE